MEISALILTPLPLEFEAARRHLTGDLKNIYKDQMAYVKGVFKGKHHSYNIVICEPGMKNTDMALATERAIQSFKPNIALLVGIAGGIKDLKIGDVAIASSAFNYEAGKESEKGFLPRPSEYPFSKELLAYAKGISRSNTWKDRTTDGAPNSMVLICPVASGDKVVAAINNPTFERIEQFLSHAKFLEMEAAGFGLAIQRYRDLHALVIRGISDLCEGKSETDKEDWQLVAAERAAGVAFELLWELDGREFINAQETPNPKIPVETSVTSELKQRLRKLISEGELSNALTLLITHLELKTDSAFYAEIILLSDRYEKLSRENRMGVISSADAGLERNRIVLGILGIINAI